MGRHRFTLLIAMLAIVCAGAPPVKGTDLHDVITDYSITSWSQKDGLPAGSVWTLAQDPEGYLWLGTDAGLFRFDGTRFVSWNALSATALPRAPVRVLQFARDGSLWVGLGGSGGVSRIHSGKASNYGVAAGLAPGAVTAIVEDVRGTIWAGNSAGLFRFENERWDSWRLGSRQTEGAIAGAYSDSRGRVYVVSAKGVFRQQDGVDQFDEVEAFQDIPRSDRDLPRSIGEDPFGRISVTDPIAGFRRVGERPASIKSTERGRGSRLLFDRLHTLWVGTYGQGLWRVRQQDAGAALNIERATALTGLLSDGVMSLLDDRDGNIWVGTTEGLNRLTPHKVRQILNLGLVTGVEALPNGRIWVGTVDRLVQYSSAFADAPVGHVSLEGSRLRALTADEAGTLWLATDGKLARIAGVNPSLEPVARSALLRQVDSMTSDGHDGVWLYDLDHGLLHWTRSGLQPYVLPDELRHVRVVTLYTDSDGRVWVTFTGGAVAYISREGRLHVFGSHDGLGSGDSRAIYEGRNHVVWLAATDGLSRFSNGAFATLSSKVTPAVDNLTAVVEDESGILWLGSGSGIVRLDPAEFEKAIGNRAYAVQYSLYDRSDGLAGVPGVYSSNRRVLRAGDGRLWFVTGRGVTIIDPSLHNAVTSAPIRVDDVIVDDRKFDPGAFGVLPPRTTRIEIDYATLNLTSPLKTRFRYRLEGFDAGWIDAGSRRQAFYTNLPHRQYRFRVVASNSNDTWSEAGAAWDFSIRPMFYETASFAIASLTACVVTLWAAWRFRIRQVRKQFSLLLGERARLSREIHDTLLQSLVGIALQFDVMANDRDTSAVTNRDRFLRMRKQVETYIREARQSIWDLRSTKLETHDLAEALREAGEDATVDGPTEFEFAIKGAPRRCPPRVEEQLLRIGQEALTNAIRHAHAKRVQMVLHYDDLSLTLRVSDDGYGFNPALLVHRPDGHYGLLSMKERAENVGGQFHLMSDVGHGTAIEAVVPTGSRA